MLRLDIPPAILCLEVSRIFRTGAANHAEEVTHLEVDNQ